MSVATLRSEIARLEKTLADLSKKISDETSKVNRLEADASRIESSIIRTTSSSTAAAKLKQANSKRQGADRARKRSADFERQRASKLGDLARKQESLGRSLATENRRSEQDEKKRRDEERRHSEKMTREEQRRAALRRTPQIIHLESPKPTAITVLFLASDAIDSQRLHLDVEARDLQSAIRMSDHRESVNVESRWAVRSSDILQALNETRPTVVHFSGHGAETSELVLVGDENGQKLVTPEAIATTIATVSESVRLVVFNTCFSRAQAERIVENVDIAIGMNVSISDRAAQVFSASFYSAVGFGLSVKTAFDQARAALLLEGIDEDDTPILISRDSVDPSEVVLVEPRTPAASA